jgi:hypothetical protein
MTRLVFVHGIGGVRDADRERATWLEALLVGVRQAGHSRVAAAMERGAGPEGVFANYANLFTGPGAQTDEDLDLDERKANSLPIAAVGDQGAEERRWRSCSPRYLVTVARLYRRGLLPRRLMPFHDDAHRLGLLRAVGPIYPFRHTGLQRYLAQTYLIKPHLPEA